MLNEIALIQNPILKGFNPDPSIIRVNDDFFIATSTFEWFPGVQIHHSRDLIHWRLLTRPLDRISQLDMNGIPNSGGIFAPCLSWDDGTFYLIYTVVHQHHGVTRGTPNYLVTAPDILGPWSEPIYLNASGFDPSLFHDDDARKWLVNMVWDHRPERHPFYGIVLQEYDHVRKELIGESRIIFKGTELGKTEGPHLFKRNGYYYLMTAEGGTRWEHAVTLARSRIIEGPYEVHPTNPVLTSWGDASLVLQKAGHADLVETQAGDWYMVHLCGRPLPGTDRCVLGRETAIQKVVWKDDDWLYLETGTNRPSVEIPAPILPVQCWMTIPVRDDFELETLGIQYQTQRAPLDVYLCSLTERPGFLRLRGGDSLESKFNQVLVARRQEAFRYEAATLLEFYPESFQQMAGLVCYYNTRLYHYLYMSLDERAGTCLYVQSALDGKIVYPLGTAFISLRGSNQIYLRARVDHARLTFSYSLDGVTWDRACDDLDASILSDDSGIERGFTGAFVGLACQDLTGRRNHADFDFLEYREIE